VAFRSEKFAMLSTVREIAASLKATIGGAGEAVGPPLDGPPRLELFHAANSICSQKVRAVLAHHKMPYSSHTMNIFSGQTYLPDYVRLRLIGCERSGVPLVSAHTGSTSMSTGGCDPAVVPTLIDRERDEVIVDSKRICLYIDNLVPDSQLLRPPELGEAIDAELAIVDGLPNYQMLTGRPIGTDLRPQQLRDNHGVKFSMSKVNRCDHYSKEFAQDRELLEAYQAKRKKELDAAEHLFSEESMRIAYAKVISACSLLENKLKTRHSTWLIANTVTMADLFWAIELLRIKNLGADHVWEENKLPAVAKFVAAVQCFPSIQASVLTWPGALF
jgi:2,5-dichlorohydroquinone reductive dechlorinase